MRSASEILDKIREIRGLDSDTALGRLFGVKQSTVASWRSRDTLPYEHIIEFCETEEISTDNLFLNKSAAEEVDWKAIIAAYDATKRLLMQTGQHDITDQKMFEFVRFFYDFGMGKRDESELNHLIDRKAA